MKTGLVLAILCLLSACGGTQHWEKPNTSFADVQHAYKECAVSLGVKDEQAALLMGTPEMRDCMNGKGFYLVN
jgi:hypothetical protein